MDLITQRLRLRELEDADWEVSQLYEPDPQYIRDARQDRLIIPRRTFDLAVTLADSGQLIGRTGIRVTWEAQREAALWFNYRRDSWGKGYATEAARAIVGFGFRQLGLHRIFGDCDPRNLGSARVMEKLGMRCEARFVENVFVEGEWCDSLIYAILDREWAD